MLGHLQGQLKPEVLNLNQSFLLHQQERETNIKTFTCFFMIFISSLLYIGMNLQKPGISLLYTVFIVVTSYRNVLSITSCTLLV